MIGSPPRVPAYPNRHGPVFPEFLSRLYVVLGVVVASACASGGSGSGARECSAPLVPHPAGAGELVDSAALRSAVEDAWLPGARLAVASLSWDSAGVPREPMVASADLPATAVATLAGAVQGAMRGDRPPGTRGYLVLGENGVVGIRRVARLGMCAPALLNRDDMIRRVSEAAGRVGVARYERIRLQARVLADGTVGEVRVDESSGDTRIDLAAARVFQEARFDPGRLQGAPIPVWVAFPVRLRPEPPDPSRRRR